MSKEGAARVAIFKETGLAQCWTLEVNYNSARMVSVPVGVVPPSKNNNVSTALLCSRVIPEQKLANRILNIEDFRQLGTDILMAISDYYQLSVRSPIFGTKLRNMENIRINTAVECLRLLPFRFNADCRKMLETLNSGFKVQAVIDRIRVIVMGGSGKSKT